MRDKPSNAYLWALALMKLLNIATGWLCVVAWLLLELDGQ